MNFVAGTVSAANGREIEVQLDQFGQAALKLRARSDRAAAGDKVTVGIRPEHFVEAAGAPAKLAARAQVVEQLGGVSYVYATSGGDGTEVVVQQRGHSAMATQAEVEFGIDPATTLLFDTGGLRL
jgi:lactose/L-arabinose transport system ATP-binding protein